MQKNKGFTLIELMVTIAVLAIVASIAAPKFQDTMEKRSIQKTATDLEKSLAQARADAVLYRKDVTVNFAINGVDDSAERYWTPTEGVDLEFSQGTCIGGSWSTAPVSTLSSTLFVVVAKCQPSNAHPKTQHSPTRQNKRHTHLPCCPQHSRKTSICEMVKLSCTDEAAACCINAATNLLMALGTGKAHAKPA